MLVQHIYIVCCVLESDHVCLSGTGLGLSIRRENACVSHPFLMLAIEKNVGIVSLFKSER
jgi:hypothetical protein